MITITKASHPFIFEAFEIISHDSDMGAGHDNYSVDIRWEPMLPAIEAKLKEIHESDFKSSEDPEIDPLNAFCVPIDDEGYRMCERFTAFTAFAFLNDFFNGWDAG